MTTTLSYAAPPQRRISKFALVTFILGCGSGPLAFIAAIRLPGDLLPFYIILAIIAVLNLIAAFRIWRIPTLHGQWFSILGFLAPFAWLTAFYYVISNIRFC